jgi:hypothetical protein
MDLPDIGRYRRRFIVEFGPEDAGLIDRMGVAHRTKRAAIIAGLRLLDSGEVERLRSRVTGLEAELAAAKEVLAAASAAASSAKPDLAQAKAHLRAERDGHRATKVSLKEARASATRANAQIAALRAERDRLVVLLPHHAYCGSCDKLVAETEWGEQPARNGYDVYHKTDGYRAKSGIMNPATVLFWRATSGGAAR